MSRRAVGIGVGALAAAGVFASPLGEKLTYTLSSGAPIAIPGPGNIRRRTYASYLPWLRDSQAYQMVLDEQPADHTTLLLMGSSELSSPVPQNPSTLLFQQSNNFDFRYAGRAGTQCLYHAYQLASTASKLQHRKAALIVSAQWFSGYKEDAFQGTFSESMWQGMLDNPALSDATRRAIVKRGTELGNDPVWFDKDAPDPLNAPYDAAVRRARVLREISAGTRSVASFSGRWSAEKDSVPVRKIDWDAARRTALREADKALVGNPYNIARPYFEAHMKGKLGKLEGSLKDLDYSKDGPEWDDLELVLAVAKETNTQLMVVSTPMNGKWYDFLGYDAARRAKFADRLRGVAKKHGIPYQDWFDQGYEKGWNYDPSHPGWLGWLDVTKALVDFGAP